MFSPVSQISNPSSLFFSLFPPFISSFHSFPSFWSFYSNNLVSIESGTFNGLNNLHSLSYFPLFLHHLIFNLSSFLFPPSTLAGTLSPPFHLVCFMVYPLSQLSSFPLISSFPFHSLSFLSSSTS